MAASQVMTPCIGKLQAIKDIKLKMEVNRNDKSEN
jgi:hypothetical protein